LKNGNRMTIELESIKSKISDVLNSKISREAASNWATKIRKAGDDRALEYVPTSDEEKIWKGIIYIEGIDTKDSPDSYLHNNHDIEDFLHTL